MIGSLRRHETLAVDKKLVALGFAAKDRMILKNQTLQPGAAPLKLQRRRESTDAAADDHAVENLAGIDHFGRILGKHLIADLMAGADHFIGIAVRPRIIAHARVACPIIGSQHLAWTQRAEQRAARRQQHRIHEVAPVDRFLHPQRIAGFADIGHNASWLVTVLF